MTQGARAQPTGESRQNKDDFLFKEYDSAVTLTNHVDDIRNNLTNFFLLFAGAAATASGFLLESPSNAAPIRQNMLVATFALLVAAIGVIFIGVLARLRRVQLERYQIIDRIRRFVLAGDQQRLDLIGLGPQTLPSEIRGQHVRTTGTYLWILSIMLPSASLFSFGVYLIAQPFLPSAGFAIAPVTVGFILLAAGFMWLIDRLYWRFARL